MNQFTILPTRTVSTKMPPLKIRQIHMLVNSPTPPRGYQRMADFTDDVVAENDRLFKCALAGFPLGVIFGVLLTLYFR